MKINKLWFSLIELLIAILIFGMVIMWWFYALSSVNIWKIKLIEKTDINKEAFYFSEKLFEEIKAWWVIDFEEYFNRFVVWNVTSSWHFLKQLDFEIIEINEIYELIVIEVDFIFAWVEIELLCELDDVIIIILIIFLQLKYDLKDIDNILLIL